MGNSQTVDKVDKKDIPILSPGHSSSKSSETDEAISKISAESKPPEEKDSGPGSFEDLHKKCKG